MSRRRSPGTRRTGQLPAPVPRYAAASCTLLRRVENADPAEHRRGAPVAYRRGLAGLALAAVERAAKDVCLRAADRLHGVPELGGGRLVGDVAQLAVQPPIGDLVEALAGELEVVPLHVDRPALVAGDEDPVLDTRDQLLGGRAAVRGPQE